MNEVRNYLSECPENVCRVTFIGAPPAEVLDHIWEAHGEAKAHFYLDTHQAFDHLPEDHLAGKQDDE